jgi:hydrogenase maturation protease
LKSARHENPRSSVSTAVPATTDDSLKTTTSRIVLIGIGNDYRHDDAAGLDVVRAIAKLELPEVSVFEVSDDMSKLMELWERASIAIVVDAVCSGDKKGTIFRIDADRGPVPSHLFHGSTHAFGVAEAIEMSRALGNLPGRLILYGIEGGEFHQGVGVSLQVQQSVREVIDLLRRDVWRLSNSPAS